ncbi:MAG: tRNA pseudouridine(13) synthase TruD [Legionellales bacterium]
MFNELHFAYGHPVACGQLKIIPEDFCVEEHLGFELTGEGEHLFLLIEKKTLNTEEMARIIARELKLPVKAISYAGLKDKFAKTTQWFSLHLPGKVDPKLDCFNTDNYRLLKSMRHNKKLKIGALKENHFKIKVNNFEFVEEELWARIDKVKTQGVPNYFGPQRFGINGSNLEHAKDILLDNKKIKNRHLRGIYYSAARAFLFNKILSMRVKEGCWNRPVPGDLMMLHGSHSIFQLDDVTDEISRRVCEHDIYPAVPLWGLGNELVTGRALQLQSSAMEPWAQWCTALEQHELQKSYRAVVLLPEHFQLTEHVFSFTLPKGAYATTVLRELFRARS